MIETTNISYFTQARSGGSARVFAQKMGQRTTSPDPAYIFTSLIWTVGAMLVYLGMSP